jgi:hypothetical protein
LWRLSHDAGTFSELPVRLPVYINGLASDHIPFKFYPYQELSPAISDACTTKVLIRMDQQIRINDFSVTFTLLHLGEREIRLAVRSAKSDDLADSSEHVNVSSGFFEPMLIFI